MSRWSLFSDTNVDYAKFTGKSVAAGEVYAHYWIGIDTPTR